MAAELPTVAARLTFMAGCMARLPFREQVAVAAGAGFDSITCWPNIWRHAQRKDGLSLSDMWAMLDDHGLVLTDCDACRDWVPPTLGPGPGPRVDTRRQEFFEVCAALGGTTVVAVHQSDAPLALDRDVEAFATLCDDAAEYGLRIALEFVPFMNVADVATAWSLVAASGRTNAGLVVDVWHHVRSGRDDAALRRVPADRVFTVQLSDGPAEPHADLADEAMYHRLLPGDGAMDVVGFLRVLGEMGVRTSVGPELNTPFQTRPPAELAAELAAATRTVLAEAASLQPPR